MGGSISTWGAHLQQYAIIRTVPAAAATRRRSRRRVLGRGCRRKAQGESGAEGGGVERSADDDKRGAPRLPAGPRARELPLELPAHPLPHTPCLGGLELPSHPLPQLGTAAHPLSSAVPWQGCQSRMCVCVSP